MDDGARRWPHWVYDEGSEPDYRFSLANERTLLAWLRTSLALLAGALALHSVDLGIAAWAREVLTVLLAASAVLCAVTAWLRWAGLERAMRRREPAPAGAAGVALALVVLMAVVAIVAVATMR